MKITKRLKCTFLTSIIVGLAAHLFALTNVLQNYDNISQTPTGVGTGAPSGRWVIQILQDFHGRWGTNYNIPMVNGLIAILLLSLGACIIVEILDIRSPLLCGVFAAVFISFPTVTSTMFFMFVSEYNTLAAFLAILAVWFAGKYRWGFLAAAACCAVSLGIYQAYLPMTASLFVILLIKEILTGEQKWSKVLCRALCDFGTLVLGFLTYYVCLKLTLRHYGIQLSDYQGVNNMGHVSIKSLPGLLKRAWMEIVRIPVTDYYGISSTIIVKAAVAVLGIVSVLLIVVLLAAKKQNRIMIPGCIALCMMFPLAVNGITIMCPESTIYTLMVFGSVFIFLLPVVLADLAYQSFKGKGSVLYQKICIYGRNLAAAVLILVSIQYVWLSNGNYMAMYYNTEQTKAYLGSMLTQVRMTEGYNTSLKWAFIGKVSDESLYNPWQDLMKFSYGGNGVTETKQMVNFYSRKWWFKHYMGYELPLAEEEKIKELKEDPFVQEMPCYPDYGSIAIYEDTVVIRLS